MVPKIIYIIGAGASGSTLLSFILGGHSEAVSVGELSRLDEYRAYNRNCTCGEKISECELWNQVDDGKTGSTQYFDAVISPFFSVWKFIFSGPEALNQDPLYTKIVRRNLKVYSDIAQVGSKTVIVDSSKDLGRLIYLMKSETLQILPILISRDGRSYLYSKQKRKNKILPAFFKWVRLNLEALLVWRALGLNRFGVRISYNDLLSDPQGTVARICEAASIEVEDGMFELSSIVQHNIAGSPSRFSMSSIDSYDKSVSKINSTNKFIFYGLGGVVWNKLFKTY